jgi:TetR/AcrR family transcriptional regulator, regulator of cefoperazone and chloramphenicol sensitivity
MFRPTGACRELVEDVFRPHFEMLLAILDELVAAETPRHTRHQLAFSVIGQCLFYRFHRGVMDLLVPPSDLDEHYTPLELADHIADFSLAGLTCHAATPADDRRRRATNAQRTS